MRPGEPGSFQISIEQIVPERWSWLHWWEANRDPYLKPMRQGVERQESDQAASAEYRAGAVELLRRQLGSDAEPERAAAALALGKIGHPSLDDFKKLIQGDSTQSARFHAILAVGFIDARESEDLLSNSDYPSPLLRRAAIAGLGMLKETSDRSVQGLVE